VRSGRPGSCGTGSPVSVAVTTSRLPDGAKTCGSVPGGTPIAPPRPQPGPDNVVLHGEWIACPNHVGLEAATADITGDPGVELTGRCTEEVDFRSGVGGLELLDYRLDCRVVDACVERDRCRVVVATSLPQAPRTQSCSRAVSHTICRRLIMFITVASAPYQYHRRTQSTWAAVACCGPAGRWTRLALEVRRGELLPRPERCSGGCGQHHPSCVRR
jgi:hypothetical protein